MNSVDSPVASRSVRSCRQLHASSVVQIDGDPLLLVLVRKGVADAAVVEVVASAVESVEACSALDDIVAAVARERVVARRAEDVFYVGNSVALCVSAPVVAVVREVDLHGCRGVFVGCRIFARAAVQGIRARAAFENIVAAVARDRVVAPRAHDIFEAADIVAHQAVCSVGRALSSHSVVEVDDDCRLLVLVRKGVGACSALQIVSAAAAFENIVAAVARERVAVPGAYDVFEP